MRTTLSIDDALLQQIRERARRTGEPVKKVINETLRHGLNVENRAVARTRFRVKPHRLGMKPGLQRVSLNQLYDQIEAERGLRARG